VAQPGEYRVIARVAGDDKIATFRARRTDGAPVLIHQLAPGVDHSDVLRTSMSYMLRHPADKGGRILDLFETNGMTHLVTTDETACIALKEWLEWEATLASQPQTSQSAGKAESAPEAPSAPVATTEAATPPASLEPPKSDPADTKKMRTPEVVEAASPTVIMQPPGEFTRVIQNPARIDPPGASGTPGQSLISSPELEVPRSTTVYPLTPPPSTSSRVIPFLASFLVVLALFLIAVVVIRQMQ
jgi:hypothetical protein